MKAKHFMLVVLTLCMFSSCKKDNESPSDVLTSRTWKRGINDKNPLTNPQGENLYYAVQDCEKDDTFIFGMDGKLTWNRNTVKCDPNELPTVTQNYILDRTAKELVLDGIKFTLAEESNNQLKYFAIIPSATGFQNLIFLLQ